MLQDDIKPELANNEFNSLLPGQTTEAGASRRTALKVALGVGYAASAMPIMAQTAIKTSSDGLKTGEISYEVNGFKVPAYYAMPAGKTNCPVVLVVQEIFGVHEYIADTCRRFAKAGYLAIASELYARQGDPTKYGEIGKLIAEVVNKVRLDAKVVVVFLALYNTVHLTARAWLFVTGYRRAEGVVESVGRAHLSSGTPLLKACGAALAGALAARSVLATGLPLHPWQGLLVAAAIVGAFALLPRLGVTRSVYIALLLGLALGARFF